MRLAEQLGKAVLLGIWKLIATFAPVVWWTWLSESLPDDAEAGGGLIVVIIQLAITLGSTLGGLLFDSHGYSATFSASALLLLMAELLAFITGLASTVACDLYRSAI